MCTAIDTAWPPASGQMDALVLQSPYHIEVQRCPVPRIAAGTDAIVRVELAGLCGSDLHPFRGKEATDGGTIMGHEFVGTVVEVGKLLVGTGVLIGTKTDLKGGVAGDMDGPMRVRPAATEQALQHARPSVAMQTIPSPLNLHSFHPSSLSPLPHRPRRHDSDPGDEGDEPLHHQLRRVRPLRLGPDLPLRCRPALRLEAEWAGPARRPGAIHQVRLPFWAQVWPAGETACPPSPSASSPSLPKTFGARGSHTAHRNPSQGASRGVDPGAHPSGGRRRGGAAGRGHPQHGLLLRAQRRARPCRTRWLKLGKAVGTTTCHASDCGRGILR